MGPDDDNCGALGEARESARVTKGPAPPFAAAAVYLELDL